MPDAPNLNINSSPLAALFGAGSTVVATQAGATVSADGGLADSTDSLPGGFQAMLDEQSGPKTAQASEIAPVAGPAAPLTNDENPTETAAMPVVATMAALGLNGNLPLGGKILPLGLSSDDSADAKADTPPPAAATPMADTTRLALAKAMTPAPRPRIGQADQTADQTKADDKSEDDQSADEDESASAPMQGIAPEPVTPQLVMPMPAITRPTDPVPAPTGADDAAAPQAAAPGIAAATPSAPQTVASPETTISRQPISDDGKGSMPGAKLAGNASQTILPTGMVATMAPLMAQTLAQNPAQNPAQLASLALGGQSIKAATGIATENGVTTAADPAETTPAETSVDAAPVAAVLRANPFVKPTVQARSAAPDAQAEATTAKSATVTLQPAAATIDTAAPMLRDTLSPVQDGLSGAALNMSVGTRVDMAAGVDNARDMGALVDRLVETRAAMRSGAPTQWVQTSIQHAEFGRVALQIRQDSGNLSVTMTSNDPGFAPAAQAALKSATTDAVLRGAAADTALQASQSLLQPAAASQTNPDPSQDNRQQAGQQGSGNAPQQFGNPSSGGQPSGQQGHQTPSRQQAPFITENQTAAPQGQTRTASVGRAPSGRSGILA